MDTKTTEKIRKLYLKGYTYRQISRITRYSTSTVSNTIRKLGVKREKPKHKTKFGPQTEPLSRLDVIINSKGQRFSVLEVKEGKVRAKRWKESIYDQEGRTITIDLENYKIGKYKKLGFNKVEIRELTEEEKERYKNI